MGWTCVAHLTLTELSLEFTEAAEGGGDELSILGLYVLQDVFPVQTDGIGDEKWAVQVSQQPGIPERNMKKEAWKTKTPKWSDQKLFTSYKMEPVQTLALSCFILILKAFSSCVGEHCTVLKASGTQWLRCLAYLHHTSLHKDRQPTHRSNLLDLTSQSALLTSWLTLCHLIERPEERKVKDIWEKHHKRFVPHRQ